MSRVFDMCDICKLDKAKQCDYNCIKKREDRIFRFHTCPKFIYDDGQPITNAEMLSTFLKDNPDFAANLIWDKVLNDINVFILGDLIKWLLQEVDIES